jgi:hypothetical protein
MTARIGGSGEMSPGSLHRRNAKEVSACRIFGIFLVKI